MDAIRLKDDLWGAFDGNKLIGFCILSKEFIGSNNQYLRLVMLHTSYEYRRKGIGKRLFLFCVEAAKKLNAKKLYITAQSSQESQAFYRAMGCVEAQEIIPELFEQEPFDVHMEYRLNQGAKISTVPVGTGTVDCSGVIRWAEAWDWGVGKIVAERLRHNGYTDWECAVVAIFDGQYAGFCTLEKKDEYGTDLDFTLITPFIGAVYVDPQFRGCRMIGKLLDAVCNYARSLGFDAVYLISSHVGLYERYGFEPYKQTVTMSGSIETVFRKMHLQSK